MAFMLFILLVIDSLIKACIWLSCAELGGLCKATTVVTRVPAHCTVLAIECRKWSTAYVVPEVVDAHRGVVVTTEDMYSLACLRQ